jgi:hypothetical protein
MRVSVRNWLVADARSPKTIDPLIGPPHNCNRAYLPKKVPCDEWFSGGSASPSDQALNSRRWTLAIKPRPIA